jgi:hypothetical protein
VGKGVAVAGCRLKVEGSDVDVASAAGGGDAAATPDEQAVRSRRVKRMQRNR